MIALGGTEGWLVGARVTLEETWKSGPPKAAPASSERGSEPGLRFLQSRERVHVVVSTRPSSELPLLLRFGGSNWCPFPDQHATLLSEWNRAWGARPVFIDHDTIELVVDRPPRDQSAQAAALAWSHLVYCTDVPDLTTAYEQAQSKEWFFWWD